MSNFAVIETGGKQYRVRAGDVLRVEMLGGKAGSPTAASGPVSFDRVLLKADGEKVEVGTPYLSGAKVMGEIIKNARSERKMVFRYHSKTNYRKKKTHRQWYTEVKITKI